MSMENKEEILSSMSSVMAQDEGLREKVRGLVLKAVLERQTDTAALKEVMRLTVSGVGDGLARRGDQATVAVGEAMQGLDEALARAVYALQMALEESWGQGRQFAQGDVTTAMEDIKDLERDLLQTLKDTADKAQGWAKGELSGLYDHLARNGTDTGTQVRGVLEALNRRLAGAASGAVGDARSTVSDAKERLSAVASGILRGLADSLDARAR